MPDPVIDGGTSKSLAGFGDGMDPGVPATLWGTAFCPSLGPGGILDGEESAVPDSSDIDPSEGRRSEKLPIWSPLLPTAPLALGSVVPNLVQSVKPAVL